MQHLLTFIDRLSRYTESAAVLLVFGYCILMLTEVVARSQGQSLSFTWEFSQYAMASVFALASGPAIRAGVHVRITVLLEILSPALRKGLDGLANFIAIAIVSVIVSVMFSKVSVSFERNILATSVSKTPLWIPQMVVLWGMAQLWLDLLARICRQQSGQEHEWRDEDTEPSDV